MTSMQPQNMLRLCFFYYFLSHTQPRWPFFQRHFGEDTPGAHPPTAQHTHTHTHTHAHAHAHKHTLLLPTPPPVGCWIVGLRDGGGEDYASVRLVKGLPWSFCCVTDGWEAEQACFAWEEKPAEGRIEVYSMRPVTQNHPPALNPHTPPLHHPSLHPFVPPPPLLFSLRHLGLPFLPSFCGFHLPVFTASFSPYNRHTPTPTLLPFLLLDFIPLNFCSFRFSLLSIKLFLPHWVP